MRIRQILSETVTHSTDLNPITQQFYLQSSQFRHYAVEQNSISGITFSFQVRYHDRQLGDSLLFCTSQHTQTHTHNKTVEKRDGRGHLDLFQEYFSILYQSIWIRPKLQICRQNDSKLILLLFLMHFVILNFSKNLFWHLQKAENSVHCVGCRCSRGRREPVTGEEQTQKFFKVCSASRGCVV